MTFQEQVSESVSWQSAARFDRTGAGEATYGNSGNINGLTSGLITRNRRSALLSRLVEAEILPRLALARAASPSRSGEAEAAGVTTENDTLELVRLLMGNEDGGAWTFIELLEVRGATPASLYLGVVTQAARRLGELWEDDRCDFAQVTIGLGRLQQVVRALAPNFQLAAVGPAGHASSVLLLPAPGEQHTFGLIILAEFFQREGWHVIGGPISAGNEATATVRDQWVDIAGFSIGSLSRVDGLAARIQAVRTASRNRSIGVMVGGPLILQHPELVARLNADTTAADAPNAVAQAKALVAMHEVERDRSISAGV